MAEIRLGGNAVCAAKGVNFLLGLLPVGRVFIFVNRKVQGQFIRIIAHNKPQYLFLIQGAQVKRVKNIAVRIRAGQADNFFPICNLRENRRDYHGGF